MTLPRGTVTFLFSDIEGSTRMVHELGDAYGPLLVEHRRMLREVWSRHGGLERSTEGDSFFVVFERAADATRAALDAQRALDESPARVRIGLHTGEPVVLDNDYMGIDVHLAARIAACAHGGQIVVSERTRSFAPADVGIVDLGPHLLKDFAKPVRLYQVGAGTFPPLRTRPITMLPSWETPILGREHEIAEIAGLVLRRRLVVLTGPGGTGKTRVAAAAAAKAADAFTYGATWVELDSVTDPALVLPAIAAALGTRSAAADYVGDKHMLLVLDNAEQVASAGADLARLLERCPNLHVLVTSRVLLRLHGEREVRVDPLSDDTAIRLFREHAPNSEPSDVVAAICRRVDRLPLAIELAAARTRVFTPEQLLERLDASLPLLTSRNRDTPERQRTLEGAIAWSNDLLDPHTQRVFARLSVFRGSFDLPAAEAVAEASPDDVQDLIEHSLLRNVDGRFSMLQTIREFAAARLASDPREQRRGLDMHAVHFRMIAEEAGAGVEGPRSGEFVRRLTLDEADIHAAIDHWSASGSPATAALICRAVRVFWTSTARIAQGARVLERVLAAPWDGDAALRAQTLRQYAWLRSTDNAPRAVVEPIHAEAVRLARQCGDAAVLAEVLRATFAPREQIRESIEIARAIGDRDGECQGMHILGELLRDERLIDEAEALLKGAVEISRGMANPARVGVSLHSLGDLELDRGAYAAARAYYADALGSAVEHGFLRHNIYCVAGLAAVAAKLGDTDRAAVLWKSVERAEETLGFAMFKQERTRYEAILDGIATDATPILDLDEASALALRER